MTFHSVMVKQENSFSMEIRSTLEDVLREEINGLDLEIVKVQFCLLGTKKNIIDDMHIFIYKMTLRLELLGMTNLPEVKIN